VGQESSVHENLELDAIGAGSMGRGELLVSSDRPVTEAPVCLDALTAESATRPRLERTWARATKRGFDIAVSVPLVLIALLLLPLLAIVVRLDSRGPALFSQERIGRSGRRIRVFKLRSMHADAEGRLRADPDLYKRFVEHGFKLPEGDDPRITRVGRILRKTSLDELPQAFSVLIGTMSAVGPRPVVPLELRQLYGAAAPVYLATKPGLTGLWQVSGRSKVGGADRVDLDATYVEDWSPFLDVRILVRTIPAVLTARGAH
jgi:lipopolysaccharide/colanic/teichoic acid biosynthesis glycosyltransferase